MDLNLDVKTTLALIAGLVAAVQWLRVRYLKGELGKAKTEVFDQQLKSQQVETDELLAALERATETARKDYDKAKADCFYIDTGKPGNS